MQLDIPMQNAASSDRPRVTVSAEFMVYLAILILALIARLPELDTLPLLPVETHNALAALRAVTPNASGSPLMPTSAILFVLQSLSFGMLGGTEFAARLATVLGGVALVMTPLLFRPIIGRTRALLLSLLLLLSPVLLATSRASSPDVWTLLFAVCGLWALWRGQHVTLAAVLLAALAFTTGISGLPLALILLIAGRIALVFRPRTALIEEDEEAAPESSFPVNALWRAVPVAALIVLAVSTGFMLYPLGLNAIGQGIGSALQAIIKPQGMAGYGTLAALYYEPVLFGFAVVSLAIRRNHLSVVDVFLAAWVGLGIVASLIIADGSPDHALWIIVPLAALSTHLLVWIFSPDDSLSYYAAPAWARGVVAVGTIAILAIFTVSFQSVARALLQAPDGLLNNASLPPDNMILLLVASMFLVIGYFLFASLWGARTSWQGVLLGFAVFGLLTSFGSGWSFSVPQASNPVEFWHMETSNPDVPKLRQTLHDVSLRLSGGLPAMPVTVLAPEDGVVAWVLRDYHETKFITDVKDATGDGVVLLPASIQSPQLGSAYVGEKFTMTRSWDLSTMSLIDLPAWWTQRQARTPWTSSDDYVLWLRQDVYEGIAPNSSGAVG